MEFPANMRTEFETVNAVLGTTTATRTVDAYCLTWIKFERQIRRILVRVLRQASVFDNGTEGGEGEVVEALSNHKDLSFEKVFRAIERLTGHSVWDWLGGEQRRHRKRLSDIQWDRNRIFHGKQTGKGKDAKSLLEDIDYIQSICSSIALGSNKEIGYDGFERNAWRPMKDDKLRKSVDAFVGGDWKAVIKRF
ncbi:hypothetical protein [Mesorhizobium sp. 128a]